MSATRTITVTASGHVTRDGARTLRDLLRAAGEPKAAEHVTHACATETARNIVEAFALDARVVVYGDLTPAQRGAVTRRTNKRAARKATPSTGFMRAYLSARKVDPTLTREAFALTWNAQSA